jgi:hypothetical protein
MNQVDAVLAERVAASRVEAATENGTVPVVVVPAEIIGPAGLRMALNAAANTRN